MSRRGVSFMAGCLSAALGPAAAAVFAQSGMPAPSSASAAAYSVNEALAAVGARDLVGVFAFIPEEKSAVAFADYLMRDRRALKRFVKKGERDLKAADGIADWDKRVFLFVVGGNAQGSLPEGVERVPARLMSRVNALSLTPSLPLEVILQKRSSAK